MSEALIIEQTGWTHEEYLAQPIILIEALREHRNAQIRAQNAAEKKAAGQR